MAGSLGGVVEACCLQPTDVVKTRLQLDRAGAGAAYRGMAHCGATVARVEGAAALWKGLTPFATHLTLKYALRQGSNASLQSRLRDPATGELSTAALLASGLGAGVAEALLVVTPFEVVKIRLQQQRGGLGPDHKPPRYRGAVHCAVTVIREEGLRGLWAGAAPTVLRNGTNQAAMFACKSKLDAALWGKRDGDEKELHFTRSKASGFLATAVGPLLTGPFDVVKSRLMAQGGDSAGAGVRYRGTAHALRTIYAEEGVRALWKGLLPRLVRIPTGGALAWAVTDQVTALYERAHLRPAAHL
jgi:solute carrier family 25 citrate transporter 1